MKNFLIIRIFKWFFILLGVIYLTMFVLAELMTHKDDSSKNTNCDEGKKVLKLFTFAENKSLYRKNLICNQGRRERLILFMGSADRKIAIFNDNADVLVLDGYVEYLKVADTSRNYEYTYSLVNDNSITIEVPHDFRIIQSKAVVEGVHFVINTQKKGGQIPESKK